MSQILSVPCSSAPSSRVPSGLNAKIPIEPSSPRIVRNGAPVSASRTWIVPPGPLSGAPSLIGTDRDAVFSRLISASTGNVRITLPVATSTTRMVLPESARYRRFPSAVQATLDRGLRELDRAAARLARRGVPEPERPLLAPFEIRQESLAVGAELGDSAARGSRLWGWRRCPAARSRPRGAGCRRRPPWPGACRPD